MARQVSRVARPPSSFESPAGAGGRRPACLHSHRAGHSPPRVGPPGDAPGGPPGPLTAQIEPTPRKRASARRCANSVPALRPGEAPEGPSAKVFRVGKTLVIAEKPSVGRDLAAALPDKLKASAGKSFLEGERYVVTWAIGHLVGLAEPEAYDERLKKWRFADLPIIPEEFHLVPNDPKAKKQLQIVHRLMRSGDVDLIVNACDAGREGELIFAYLYQTAKTKKPVQRLWLNSMTRKAIEGAFGHLRPEEDMRLLEDAARSRSEADWLVGVNATRAAAVRP